MHDVPQRSRILNLQSAHKGKVSGLCWGEGDRLLSCGVDRNVKLWDTREEGDTDTDAGPSEVRDSGLNLSTYKLSHCSVGTKTS